MSTGRPSPHRRHGNHVTDHLRRLELVANPPAPGQARGSSFRPLAIPCSRRDIVSPTRQAHGLLTTGDGRASDTGNGEETAIRDDQGREESARMPRHGDSHLTAVFTNLRVWMANALAHASCHAGFDKIHLYAVFLQCLVEELVPHTPQIQETVANVIEYVAYLSGSSSLDTGMDTVSSLPIGASSTDGYNYNANGGHFQAMTSSKQRVAPNAMSPRVPAAAALPIAPWQPLRPSGSVLSPRAIKVLPQEAAATGGAALPLSPRIPARKDQKRIIQLSEHETAMLELALFYQEARAQLVVATDESSRTGKKVTPPRDSSLTEQWLQLSRERHRSELRRIKKQLSRELFFRSEEPQSRPSSMRSTRMPSETTTRPNGTAAHVSLVALCLQETIRQISVFSAEAATFAWRVCCQDTFTQLSKALADALAKQHDLNEQLQELKLARETARHEITQSERNIQRLQVLNMQSLAVSKLEEDELEMLEREERWHGNCKALVFKNLTRLQAEVNRPTWLQLNENTRTRNENDTTTARSTPADAVDCTDQVEHANELEAMHEPPAATSVEYQRLPPEAAALHSRRRVHIVYTVHLLTLCRSFLHLHQKRGLRDVIESTKVINAFTECNEFHTESPGVDDESAWPLSGHTAHVQSAITCISIEELQTLREINNALRAIEVLYAQTEGWGQRNMEFHHSGGLAGRHGHGKHGQSEVGTQFPALKGGKPSSFLRSLSYCTVAATSFSMSSLFTPVGASSKKAQEELLIENAPTTLGSGRRRGSTQGVLPSDDSSPVQPSIRLSKALVKLPKHIKDILILPLLSDDPFPPGAPNAVVISMSRDELVENVEQIYADQTEGGALNENSASRGIGAQILKPGPAFKSWEIETLLELIRTKFIETANNDIVAGETEFIRFMTSLQLYFHMQTGGGLSHSGNSSMITKDTLSGEILHFFSRMIRLYSSDANARGRARLSTHTFSVFIFCRRVLQQVAIAKKHVEEGGVSTDIWVLADPANAMPKIPTGSSQLPRSTRPSLSQSQSQSPYSSVVPYVLLDSVQLLLVHLIEATSPDAHNVMNHHLASLQERSLVATVSILAPATPGPFSLSSDLSGLTTTNATALPNGELNEVFILPLTVAVHALVGSWLKQYNALQIRMSVAMRAGLVTPSGEISFSEFAHIMTIGSGGGSSHAPVDNHKLIQIYTAVAADTKRGLARWQDLLPVTADEMDLMGVRERLHTADFRTLQVTLQRRGYARPATGWLARPPYRNGPASELRKLWKASSVVMQDDLALAFQTDDTLHGLRVWQTCTARFLKAEALIRGKRKTVVTRTRRRRALATAGSALEQLGISTTTTTTTTGTATTTSLSVEQALRTAQLISSKRAEAAQDHEMEEVSEDALALAWCAFYYLQRDHAHAHHVADLVRLKQQQQKQHQQQQQQQQQRLHKPIL